MAKPRQPSKPRRPRAHSLLNQYGKRSQSERIAAIRIEDPYATSAHQVVKAVAPPIGAHAKDGPTEWQAPPRPRIEVLAAIRDDVAAKMYARHQIDEAMFGAARNYQATYERAESLRNVRSVDLSMPPISGAVGNQFESAAMALHAANELKRIEKALSQRSGEDGVTLVRDVLGAGKTIERAAAERGDSDKQRVSWWGGRSAGALSTWRRFLDSPSRVPTAIGTGSYSENRHGDGSGRRSMTTQEAKARALRAHKAACIDARSAAIYNRWLSDTLLAAKNQPELAATMFVRLAIALEVMCDMRGWSEGRMAGLTA